MTWRAGCVNIRRSDRVSGLVYCNLRGGCSNLPERCGNLPEALQVNRRYRGKLKKPVELESGLSNMLRRIHTNEGKLHLARPGKAFHEALYWQGE